jgi:CheY-like chemotaxis protein
MNQMWIIEASEWLKVVQDAHSCCPSQRLCGKRSILTIKIRITFRDAPLPDVLVLDLNLPKKNGHQVLSEIRQAGDVQRIPVIILTSSFHPSDRQKAIALGANG